MNPLETPMFRQFFELKEQVPDALLFFRMGDFYELFGEDAVYTAGALELTLTARNKDDPNAVPMCGVPHHAAEGYLRRLLELGKKVAIADQVEDPKLAKGLVKRAIVRVLTPGLVGEYAEAHEPTWLVAVAGGPGAYGFASLDASTGDLRVTELTSADEVLAELARVEPKEALLAPEVDEPELRRALGAACVTPMAAPALDRGALQARFDPDGLAAVGDPGLVAVTMALGYAERWLRAGLAHVLDVRPYVASAALGLDEATRRNLELFRPLRGAGRKGTVIGLVDVARTAMGGRALRDWLGAPLVDVAAIRARHAAVEALVDRGDARRAAVDALSGVADLERIAGRVVQGTATPRDLGALRGSLARVPVLRAALPAAVAAHLADDDCADVLDDLSAWLTEDLPATLTDGDVIRDGADPELDRLRTLARDARGSIAAMEARLRDATGVASLKVRHNAVFGFFIEVTKANLHRVPTEWHRKQTVAGGERFITAELKEYEEAVVGADDTRVRLEAARFGELRARVAANIVRLQRLAAGVATADALCAFAELAVRHRWCRPDVGPGFSLDLEASRHPVVEATLRDERFVPNDLRLDERGRVVVLTGPNMAGKSTLMRQVALVVLLAQAGSFVPASRATVGVCDRIFVRVGASDDLSRGQSTFMVEMSETANILAGATAKSLVLLDEIGRGTSTYDGLAIAWAVAEDLHDRVRCRAVFATHYHELAALSESCPQVRNLHVSVAEHGEKIVFLRRVKEGPASGSYGIQCARLAGLPHPVVARARALLKQLERRRPRAEATQMALFGAPAAPDVTPQPPAAAPLEDPLRTAITALDPDRLSPREAHEALYRLRALLG